MKLNETLRARAEKYLATNDQRTDEARYLIRALLDRIKPVRDRAVIVRDGEPELITVTGPITLDYIQGIVGGYIEIADQFPAGKVMLQVWCNEEGKIHGLPFNVNRRDGEPLVGTLIVLAGDMRTGDTLPLTRDESQRVKVLRSPGHPPTLYVE